MIRRTLAISAFTIALAAPALAGGFDVKGTDVTKGETEIGTSNAVQSGFPVNADTIRFTGDAGISYGFTDWWKAGLKIQYERAVGGDLTLTTVGAEIQFLLRKAEGRGPAIAWFTGVDLKARDDQTNTATFGPLWQWALDDKTSFTANTLFSRTFGDNKSPGTDFSYAVQLKREVREGFGVGLEGYGLLPNISDMPGSDFHEHRFGPVLYWERSLARSRAPAKMSIKDAPGPNGTDADDKDSGPKLSVEAGILFGVTDATPDRTYKIKGAITF